MKNQDNGNKQLNSARNEFNDRVESKLFSGRTKKVFWTGAIRFISIYYCNRNIALIKKAMYYTGCCVIFIVNYLA